MNPEQLEATMRTGAEQLAEATPLTPASVIRARGDRYRRRRMAEGAVVGLAIVAGAATGAAAIAGQGASPPAPPPAVARPSTVRVHLTAPAVFAYDVPNPVQVRIRNLARPRTVLVTVGLGSQRIDPNNGDMPPSVERGRPGSGGWQPVPVRHGAAGWTASYRLWLGKGLTPERLRIVPSWTGNAPPAETQPLSVTVSSGGQVLGRERAPAAPVRYVTSAVTARRPVPGSGVWSLAISARNQTSTAIPLVLMLDTAACNVHGTACHDGGLPAADQLQRWDGSAWRQVKLSQPPYGTPVTSWQLPAGSRTRIRLRLITGGSSGKGTTKLTFIVETQNPLAFVELRRVLVPNG